MATPSPDDVTQLLVEWRNGNRSALDRLIPLVEGELRRLARSYMRRERSDHTLQTTALINEAYMRLVKQRKVQWQNRAHFFAIAAQLMRRVLIDHAKGHRRAKRGGGAIRVSLDDVAAPFTDRSEELLALDAALNKLSAIDARKGQVVEMRYFGGLTFEEAAEVLEVSPNTVMRDWRMARAWLEREISGGGSLEA
jgi:RNA polymerase sigma factor (TIGR02999 family)